MNIKNVSRQPLCVQGKTRGIHLMPGEVREVAEGELSTPQAMGFIKQGLLQVITAPLVGSGTKQKKSTTNPELTNQREVNNG